MDTRYCLLSFDAEIVKDVLAHLRRRDIELLGISSELEQLAMNFLQGNVSVQLEHQRYDNGFKKHILLELNKLDLYDLLASRQLSLCTAVVSKSLEKLFAGCIVIPSQFGNTLINCEQPDVKWELVWKATEENAVNASCEEPSTSGNIIGEETGEEKRRDESTRIQVGDAAAAGAVDRVKEEPRNGTDSAMQLLMGYVKNINDGDESDRDRMSEATTSSKEEIRKSYSNGKRANREKLIKRKQFMKRLKNGYSKRTNDAANDSGKYKCKECGSLVSTLDKIFYHVKNVHFPIKEFSCSNCEYKTSIGSNMIRHLMSIHKIAEYESQGQYTRQWNSENDAAVSAIVYQYFDTFEKGKVPSGN